MKETKEASRPPPRKIPITRRRVGSGWESWSAVIHCAPCRRKTQDRDRHSHGPIPRSSGTHFHGTLHLAHPHRLRQLQAMSDDDCEVQSDFVPSRRIRYKIPLQRLARQGDNFRFMQRGCGCEGEPIRRNQSRPAHGLPRSHFFHEDIFFPAPDLHREGKPDSAAFGQEQAIGRVSQPEQFGSGGNQQPGAKSQNLLGLGGRETVQQFMRHELLSQFTNGEAVLLCRRACVGNAMNTSAAACSIRTWFSICSSRTSMGTCRGSATGGTVGVAAARSEKKRAGADALTNGSWGCTAKSDDFERVAAPNAAAATPIPNTATHKPIKSISMAETLLLRFSSHVRCQRWPCLTPFPSDEARIYETSGLPECQVQPDYSSVVDGCPHVCNDPAISVPSC